MSWNSICLIVMWAIIFHDKPLKYLFTEYQCNVCGPIIRIIFVVLLAIIYYKLSYYIVSILEFVSFIIDSIGVNEINCSIY